MLPWMVPIDEVKLALDVLVDIADDECPLLMVDFKVALCDVDGFAVDVYPKDWRSSRGNGQ